MIDEALVSGVVVHPFEDNGRVRPVPVSILDEDPHPFIVRQIGPVKGVGRIGRSVGRKEPVGVVDDPLRIDPHVIRNHVGREPDSVVPGTIPQLFVRGLSSESISDSIVLQGVGRRHRIVIAHHPLDALRRGAALPDSDEPQSGDSPPRQKLQFFVGNPVEGGNLAAVPLAQLRQPHVGVLRQKHQPRHPLAVVRVVLTFLGKDAIVRWLGGRPRTRSGGEIHSLLLGQEIETAENPVQFGPEESCPHTSEKLQLALERGRGGSHGCVEAIEERLPRLSICRRPAQDRLDVLQCLDVVRVPP